MKHSIPLISVIVGLCVALYGFFVHSDPCLTIGTGIAFLGAFTLK